MEIDPKYEGKIARMRNLKLFAGKSDEEIYEHLIKKEVEDREKAPPSADQTYQIRYKKLIDKLQNEYGVDMNESNDAESLKLLVKHTLQLENLDTQIQNLQMKHMLTNEDTRTLKNLSDVQRSTVQSITELQDRLGISRKARREKQQDNIPAYIEGLKKRGKEFFDKVTTQVRCEVCKIELGRYWLNFPKEENIITMELTCWKCKEKVIHVR